MKDILPVAISVHFLPRLSVISAPYNDSFSATGLQCLQCSPESPAQCDPDNNQETYPKNNCDQAKDACIWSWTGNLLSNHDHFDVLHRRKTLFAASGVQTRTCGLMSQEDNCDANAAAGTCACNSENNCNGKSMPRCSTIRANRGLLRS